MIIGTKDAAFRESKGNSAFRTRPSIPQAYLLGNMMKRGGVLGKVRGKGLGGISIVEGVKKSSKERKTSSDVQ